MCGTRGHLTQIDSAVRVQGPICFSVSLSVYPLSVVLADKITIKKLCSTHCLAEKTDRLGYYIIAQIIVIPIPSLSQ